MSSAEQQTAAVAYCENCFYFLSHSPTDTVEGICRRYPPMTWFGFTPWSPSSKSHWPIVKGGDWCGEHRKLITT